ncbi:MAG: hypothetical protein AAGC67_02270 [Myxococcota bacterium]
MSLSTRCCRQAAGSTHGFATHRLRSVLACLLVAGALAGAGPADAQLQTFTITGTLDGSVVQSIGNVPVVPVGAVPYEDGAAYSLTFDFDTSAGVLFGGPNFLVYDPALLDIEGVVLPGGGSDIFSADSGGVVEIFDLSIHSWRAGVLDTAPNFASTVPSVDVMDGDGTISTLPLSSFEPQFRDFSAMLYANVPAELIPPPDLSEVSEALVNMTFREIDGADVRQVSISGTIDSVTVPEPAFALGAGLGFAALALLPARSRAVEGCSAC